MILGVLAFLGGMLTIFSPCILPVLPFVFARAQQPFLRSALPLLAGMSLTFAGVATLAAVGGSWAVHINQFGRIAALAMLTIFAIALLSRHTADWIARPFISFGNRLIERTAALDSTSEVAQSLVIGVATGLLWAPCAGPILGLVLTGAAISGPNAHTTLLLFAYAAGAAASLALALFAGGRIFVALKRGLGAGEWIRRSLGAAVLVSVVAIALGWDSGVLTRLSLASTARLEQTLISSVTARTSPATSLKIMAPLAALPIEGQLPSLAGATSWLNSPPLTPEALHGKVVVIDFWTYSCINCLRSLPYVKQWREKYKRDGLVVIGVHAPEFAFEKDPDNVRRAVRDLGISYPVALDNDYAIWRGFGNQYWPAHYFIDAMGNIRGHHFGEGDYEESEQVIRQLLSEAGAKNLPPAGASISQVSGIQAPADDTDIRSPETYIGYARAEHFSSIPGVVPDQPAAYTVPDGLALNHWGLRGTWIIGKEKAMLVHAPGAIVFKFHARDSHLVLGPGANREPVHFRVTLDGAAPGSNHGVDVVADGIGVIREQRLCQLIRQTNDVHDQVLTIEFLDDGVQAYAFTFG